MSNELQIGLISGFISLKNYIHGLPEIELLTNKVKESAEISPAINCKKNELTILFQTFTIELELFEAMVNFVYK